MWSTAWVLSRIVAYNRHIAFERLDNLKYKGIHPYKPLCDFYTPSHHAIFRRGVSSKDVKDIRKCYIKLMVYGSERLMGFNILINVITWKGCLVCIFIQFIICLNQGINIHKLVQGLDRGMWTDIREIDREVLFGLRVWCLRGLPSVIVHGQDGQWCNWHIVL